MNVTRVFGIPDANQGACTPPTPGLGQDRWGVRGRHALNHHPATQSRNTSPCDSVSRTGSGNLLINASSAAVAREEHAFDWFPPTVKYLNIIQIKYYAAMFT